MPVHSSFLSYFKEVCECGSIRQAARNLHVASSAVNRQILKIENELDIALFERRASGIVPTRAGELLYKHISETLRDADQVLSDIQSLKNNDRETITIVGQESVISRFLPPVLVSLHAQFPNIASSFQAASGTILNQLILSGAADIALAFDTVPHPDIRICSSRQLTVGAIMSKGHPLSNREKITMEQCEPYPVVLPDRSWPLRGLLDPLIESTEVNLDIVTSSNSEEFLRSMLDQQMGVGFQTVMGIEDKLESGELKLVPLIGDQEIHQNFSICINQHLNMSNAMERLIDMLSDRLAKYSA